MLALVAAVDDIAARLPLLGLSPTGQVRQLTRSQLSVGTFTKPAFAVGP